MHKVLRPTGVAVVSIGMQSFSGVNASERNIGNLHDWYLGGTSYRW
jgi:hypothetical protein